MDIKTLLETPHRSVHWAFLNRLRAATTASTESPETVFSEWRKLISQDVATRAPHVFAEAIDQVAQLTLAGRISITQTVQAFTDLVAPPNIQKRSVLDPSLLSAVCGAFVQLLVAGSDKLAFKDAESARDTIMRTALERDSSLFSPVLQSVYNTLLRSNSDAGSSGSDAVFATKWANAGRFLKYAIADPTVPPWAQGRTLHLLFDLMRELAVERAVVVLDWLVDVGLVLPHSCGIQNVKSTSVKYMQVDVQGRWTREQLFDQCTRAVELACMNTNLTDTASSATCDYGCLDKLVSIVNRLRLMVASLLFSGTGDMDFTLQTRSCRSSHNRAVLASVLDRLSASAMSLSACGVLGDSQVHPYPNADVLVWTLSAIQAANAESSDEQSNCLSVLDRILNSKSVFASIPEQIVHVARFPLLFIASSGFSQQTCSTAIRIYKDIDQKLLPMDSVFIEDAVTPVRKAMVDLAASMYVSGLLPLLFIAIDNYMLVFAAKPSVVIKSMNSLSTQAFFLAPFLFSWNSRSSLNSVHAALAQVALADLLSMLSKQPSLRLALLPLFVYLLRRPETPSNFQQILVRDGIPSLATTKDAFSTSRVVSVISQIWNRSKDLSAATSSGISSKGDGNNRLRLCCLAVRAWANIVKHNPRVWRDLKPIVVQFVESKKAAAASASAKAPATCVLDPEYEWTVLMTIRDLVLHEPDKYADEVLPMIYALFTYARDSLSVSSTAVLVDILGTCVESHVADARNIWTAILAAQADFWLVKVDGAGSLDTKTSMADQTAPVLSALAHFFTMVATKGDGSGPNATFRYGILLRYVAPICGLSIVKKSSENRDDDVPAPDEAKIVSAGFFSCLSTQTRNAFLSALAAFPTEDILPLVSGGSPTRLLHELLGLATYKMPSSSISGLLAGKGCLADLFSVLMDNEVRFMRQSVFSGRNAVSRSLEDNDKQTVDVIASSSQKRIWSQSNFDRSKWVNEALSPALRKTSELYWSNGRHGGSVLASGNALASMVSADCDVAGQKDRLSKSSISEKSESVERDPASSNEQQVLAAELGSLISDVRLTNHWCVRNLAADTWQMWFTRNLRKVQSSSLTESEGGSDDVDSEVAAGTSASTVLVRSTSVKMLAVLQTHLGSSGIPAHVENAIYAIAGLVKAVWSFDQVVGSELCADANRLLAEHDILPVGHLVGDFWTQKASSRNRDVLVAAIECASATSICQSHDIAAISRLAQFLMSGLTDHSAAGMNNELSPPIVYALGRSLLHLHTALSGQKPDTRTFSEETVVVEADDIRRCIERLDVLRPDKTAACRQDSRDIACVDIGSIGLAVSLAAMHRRWISNIINPAMTEHNATPRAAQAQRTIAITLEQAFTNLSSVGKEQWSSQSAASLYYLCFVWPPRPIAQRHVELHKDLFAVTPDRVWQTANRLVRKLWAGSENDGRNAGSRNISLINHVEIAFATLTYHMTMTASQNTAKTAHIRLVEQYSGYIRGETDSLAENLAANEKSNLRVNSVVALAILLGVPMHGVAETTASNEYLPKTQQRNLPVLLGIGSVQYGSTAWLRVADSLLHESMGSLLSCAGLSQGRDTDDTDLGYTQAEVDDVRVAHVSSFVLGGLFAQSARAMHLLSLTDDVSAATLSGGRSAEDESLQRPGVDNRDGPSGVDDQAATAVDEEPKSLGHLPAPTSWCRAVWETIGDLSRSMVVSDGAISSLVECKMAMLLLSILRMERPFPVVDMQTTFSSVLYSYILDLRAGGSNDKAARLFPVMALLLRVSSKLGSISHSASQILMECCYEIVSRAVEFIESEARLGDTHAICSADPSSLIHLCLSCLGVTGLGSVLKLAGFPSGKRERKDDYLDPAIRRLITTDARWAEEKLEIALQKTLPLYLQKSEPVQVEEVVESDAQRMFRLMSKVGIQESQTVSVCTKLLVHVFSKVGKACPAVVALEIMFLSTLETHLSTMTGKGVQEKVAAKINYLIYDDLAVMATDYIAEEEAMLWSAVGIIYSCTDADAASSIRAKYNDPSDMTDFVRIVETMSVILRHKMAGHSRIVQNTSDGPENYLSSNIVDMWIQLAFVEWTFYINSAHAPKLARLNRCLQNVALAIFDWRRSVGGGQFCVSDACRLIIQGLDMAILAVTKCYPSVSRKSASKDSACISDPTGTVVAGTFAYWILPLLTGRCYSSPSLPNDSTNDPLSTLIVSAVFACGEVLEYVNLASKRLHAGPTIGSDAETSNEQQFSVQLRTRIQRLLELLSHSPVKRILQSVLSDLAVLGMLPTSDLSSVL